MQLNHTVVLARNREASARFYSEVLGVPVAGRMGPFVVVAMDNAVTLDFVSVGDGRIPSQHYAFKVSEQEWDETAHVANTGVHFGYRYSSAAIRTEDGPEPRWDWSEYVPTTWPGGRPPSLLAASARASRWSTSPGAGRCW